MRRGIWAPITVVILSVAAGGWLLDAGVDRAENVYVRVRVLQEVVDRVESSFVNEVDTDRLYNSAIDGLVRDLGDAHSSFLPRSDYENLRIRTEGDYGGVGLEVIDRNGHVTVVSPIAGSPGQRAGIRAGDQFFEIDGVAADTMVTDQAVEILRGRPGAAVTVKMLRPGVDEPIEFSLERAVIRLKAVPFALLLEDGVGYVPLQTVRETSSREIKAAVDSLRQAGMTSLVLDLRGNPGGLLDEGIGVSDLFLEPGLGIVETRGRAVNQNETYESSRPDLYPGMPIVVLVDGSSASASEIIAGALQDHDRAAVIGETTYGKGSVQSLFQLTGGDVLRLTTARWFTPVGRSINKEDQPEQVDSEEHPLSISGQMVEPPSLEGRPEHTSLGGRKLYGGGGIVPDVFVAPETLSPAEIASVREVYQRAGRFAVALFNFSVEYVRDHPSLEPGFTLSTQDVDAFYRALPAWDATLDPEVFRGAQRFVRYHLEREIALQAWGDEGQFVQSRKYDSQLKKAMELLVAAPTPAALFELMSQQAREVPAGG